MSTKVTDLTALATTDDSDVLHIIDVGDDTGGAAGTSKKITVSNLLASAGSVDSVNGQTGTVVLDVDDLDDVDASSPSNNDVLKWTAGVTNKWQPVDWLSVLYTEFKLGGSTSIGNGGLTNSNLNLTSTQAKLKSGITGIEITETSPGDIDLIVATDATGSTAYTALNIDGSTTANEADINVHGKFYIHDAPNGTKAFIRLNSAGNVNLSLPTSSGTLALTSDIPSAGIAAVVDDTSPQLGGNLDVQAREIDTSTTNGNIIVAPNGTGVLEVKGDTNDGAIQLNCNQNSHGVKIQSPPHSAAASYTLVLPDDTGTSGQVLTTDGSGNLSFTTVSGGGTNTNLGNANLTADNNRTYDCDGNSLTFDLNGGDFRLEDSGTSDVYLDAGSNELGLGDSGMPVKARGVFRAEAGIEQDEAGLTVAGAYGDGADITFLGSSTSSTIAGRVYYYSGATWVFYTSASEAPQKALLGVAIGTTMAKGFILKGFVNPNGATGLTAGETVFGATNASITSTAPTSGYQRIMGHAISSTVIYFNPSAEYIDLT